MHRDSPELIPTRASLLERLKSLEDQASWQEFFDTYWRLIYNVARGAQLTDTEAHDVVQETMVTAVKHLPKFQYDPTRSFKGWLLKATRCRIIDQLRKRAPLSAHRCFSSDTGTTSGTDTVANVADPACPPIDDIWEKEWRNNLFDAALSKIKKGVDPRQYQIFDCCLKEEQRQGGAGVAKKDSVAEKVAETFGVSVNYVYVAKHRVKELIKTEVRRLRKETM